MLNFQTSAFPATRKAEKNYSPVLKSSAGRHVVFVPVNASSDLEARLPVEWRNIAQYVVFKKRFFAQKIEGVILEYSSTDSNFI